MTDLIASDATWLASDRRLARFVARPALRFLHVEAAGGVLLLVATAIALVWANSPWAGAYDDLWHTVVRIDVGGFTVAEDLGHWINDGLMALFFFVIGLEIKTELTDGQLSTPRLAALPAAAALGGMVVPAAVFAVLNAGGPGAAGWGIPMATDIAFAVGVLALLGSRVPAALKVFLLGLAIADDIGAIAVIALFYTERIELGWLAAAFVGLVAVALLQRGRVWYTPLYALIGVAVWLCVLRSGVHATIAGVALGLLTPARALLPEPDADRVAGVLSTDTDVTAAEARAVGFALRESISPAERLAHALHPWTSYVIVPLFALANAGLPLGDGRLGQAVTSPVTMGVVGGLVIGKLVGITGATWLATRFRLAHLPEGVGMAHVAGMAAIAGIGFTVSIFITGLAYDDAALADEAKIGVLVASLLAAVLGVALLRRAPEGPAATPDGTVDEERRSPRRTPGDDAGRRAAAPAGVQRGASTLIRASLHKRHCYKWSLVLWPMTRSVQRTLAAHVSAVTEDTT